MQFGAAFMRRHAVGMQRVGTFHSGLALAPTISRLLLGKSHLLAWNETVRKDVSYAQNRKIALVRNNPAGDAGKLICVIFYLIVSATRQIRSFLF
jgi:hypothetical protein